jgi:hypothetical protein
MLICSVLPNKRLTNVSHRILFVCKRECVITLEVGWLVVILFVAELDGEIYVSCWMLLSVFYEVKKSLMLRPHPSVRSWPGGLSATNLLSVVMRCRMGVYYKTLSSWREFRENRLSESHTLFKGVNVLYRCSVSFLTDLSEIRCRRSPYNAVKLIRWSWKSVQWKPYLFCLKTYVKICPFILYIFFILFGKKFDIRDFHKNVLSDCEFRWNRRSESRRKWVLRPHAPHLLSDLDEILYQRSCA